MYVLLDIMPKRAKQKTVVMLKDEINYAQNIHNTIH